MNTLEQNVSALYGRQLTDAEKLTIMRIAKVLGLRDDDAFLGVVAALLYFVQLHDDIRGKIAATVSDVLEKARLSCEAQARASERKIEEHLAVTAVDVAKSLAKNVARRDLLKWVAISSATILLLFSIAVEGSYRWGMLSGRNKALLEVQEAKLLLEWAATPDGKQAHRLASVADIDRFSRCTGKGWKKMAGWCYPTADGDNQVHGWRLPE